MSGRNLNVYLSDETYQKLEPLIKERKVSKFIQEAIEEKFKREKEIEAIPPIQESNI